MWRAVGKMGDKERAMVEERIKRSGAAPGSAASRGGVGPVKVGGKIVVPPGGEFYLWTFKGSTHAKNTFRVLDGF